MKFSNAKKSPWLATGLALAAVASTSTVAVAANAKICFEAESADSKAVEKPLRKVLSGPNKKYSGKGYIEIPWDQNKTKGIGQATYRINVKTPGIYYLWARTYWANGCGNSIKVLVNGSARTLGGDGTYDNWHWVDTKARVTLKAGLNIFVLKNAETGIRVDQFFLCQDPDYVPTGIRTPNV
ncbi:MAG TPA: hypothetical protein VNA16_07135 [Abditibacteriaceae bacterium]|nr:hypothetical protein [Abditibacteriaceae bacterium]